MKPLGIKNYGSIPHLHNSKLGEGDHYIEAGQERILTEKTRDKHDTVFVFEKYDGSNVGIAKCNNKIIALTRSGYEAHTSPYKQHHYFSEWVKQKEGAFSEILSEGERIVGEWLAMAHGVVYTIKNDPVVFFDYFTTKNKRTTYAELCNKADKHGLQLPRLLHSGIAASVEQLLPELNKKTPTIQSEAMPEGMVFRVERKGEVDFLAKWVRNDFTPGKYCINVADENLTWNIGFKK